MLVYACFVLKLAIEKTKVFFSSAFELGAEQSGTLPALSAESGLKLVVRTKLVFKRTSSHDYPDGCIDGAPVSFVASNDGITPAQVQWEDGFVYV